MKIIKVCSFLSLLLVAQAFSQVRQDYHSQDSGSSFYDNLTSDPDVSILPDDDDDEFGSYDEKKGFLYADPITPGGVHYEPMFFIKNTSHMPVKVTYSPSSDDDERTKKLESGQIKRLGRVGEVWGVSYKRVGGIRKYTINFPWDFVTPEMAKGTPDLMFVLRHSIKGWSYELMKGDRDAERWQKVDEDALRTSLAKKVYKI